MAEQVKGPMATPGVDHERLQPFVGKFRAEVRVWMGPGDPMVSAGTMTNTLDLGGLFLRHEYTGDPNDGPFPSFEGRGFWGYNPIDEKYEGFWIDNASGVMQLDSGAVDVAGKVWTMTGQAHGPGGHLITKRSVITLDDDDHHTLETYFVGDDQEFKGMEIRYTRAG